MKINADGLHFQVLNEQIRSCPDEEIVLDNVLGQRYIGAGLCDKKVKINGVPGNALGAYLNNSRLEVFANAQDATGDTMNAGEIIIHGNCGDALGYGMRNGKIFVEGYAGYRAGIHMKQYQELKPVLVIGGVVGDFLGEYQAGGQIIVLGIGAEDKIPVGSFCGTGMHGGAIYLRTEHCPTDLPAQVCASDATPEDIEEIRADVTEFAKEFGYNADELLSSHFYKLTPNTANPYRQLYVNN